MGHTNPHELLKPFPDPIESISAADRNKDSIRDVAIQLMEQLKGDGLGALDSEGIRAAGSRAKSCGREAIVARYDLPLQTISLAASKNAGTVQVHQCELKFRRFFVTENERIKVGRSRIGGG